MGFCFCGAQLQHFASTQKAIPQTNFLSRYSNFSPAEQCNFLTSAVPVPRDGLHKFINRYRFRAMLTIKEGWQPEMKQKYPQFFSYLEGFGKQPDGVPCLGDSIIIIHPLCKVVLD